MKYIYAKFKYTSIKNILFFAICLLLFKCGNTNNGKNVKYLEELKSAIKKSDILNSIDPDLPGKINKIIDEDQLDFKGLKEAFSDNYNPDDVDNDLMLEIENIKDLKKENYLKIFNELKNIIKYNIKIIPKYENQQLQLIKKKNTKFDPIIDQNLVGSNPSINTILILQYKKIHSAKCDNINNFIKIDSKTKKILNIDKLMLLVVKFIFLINEKILERIKMDLETISKDYSNLFFKRFNKKTNKYITMKDDFFKINIGSSSKLYNRVYIDNIVCINKIIYDCYKQILIDLIKEKDLKNKNILMLINLINLVFPTMEKFQLTLKALYDIKENRNLKFTYKKIYLADLVFQFLPRSLILFYFKESMGNEIKKIYSELKFEDFYYSLNKIIQEQMKKDYQNKFENNNELFQFLPFIGFKKKNIYISRLKLENNKFLYLLLDLDILKSKNFRLFYIYDFCVPILHSKLLEKLTRTPFVIFNNKNKNKLEFPKFTILLIRFFRNKISFNIQTRYGINTFAFENVKSNEIQLFKKNIKEDYRFDFQGIEYKLIKFDSLFDEFEFSLMQKDEYGQKILKTLNELYELNKFPILSLFDKNVGISKLKQSNKKPITFPTNSNNNSSDIYNDKYNDIIEADYKEDFESNSKSEDLLQELKNSKNDFVTKIENRISKIQKKITQWTTQYNCYTDRKVKPNSKSWNISSKIKNQNKPLNIKKRKKELEEELNNEKKLLEEYQKIIIIATKKIKKIEDLSKLFKNQGLNNVISKPTKKSKKFRMKVDRDSIPIFFERQHGKGIDNKKTEGLNIKTILNTNIKEKIRKIDKLQNTLDSIESTKNYNNPKNKSKAKTKPKKGKKKKKK